MTMPVDTFCPSCGADVKPYMRGPDLVEWWCTSSRRAGWPALFAPACREIARLGGWGAYLREQREEGGTHDPVD